MFRNYLATALRNLVRNRLYTAINIVGLSLGFATALMIALYVRGEYSFEKFIPGRDAIYHIVGTATFPASSPIRSDRLAPKVAAFLKAESSSIEEVTRLFMSTDVPQPILRQGAIEGREDLLWADPNVFAVLPLPAVAGDVQSALVVPDGIVLTRSLARKYFGRDDPIGETLELDRKHLLRVTAVIEDLPPETHLRFGALVSGLSSVSPQAEFETTLAGNAHNYDVAFTYLRLKAGTDEAVLEDALRAVVAHPEAIPSPPLVKSFEAEPITAIHLRPSNADAMKPSTGRDSIAALAIVGLLIVFVAGINFVNLMTARSIRRAMEVGVRKTAGAARPDLMVQFIGESAVYTLAGTLGAVALTLSMLPTFSAFVERSIFMHVSAGESIGVVLAILAFSAIAGFYPAFVLSALSPSRALWAGRRKALGSDWGQQVLVSIQFAVFVGLILAGGLIWRQTVYGMREGLRIDADAVLIVNAGGCVPAFAEAVRQLPGVHGAACSLGAPLEWFHGVKVNRVGGADVIIGAPSVDFGLLELYGLKPLAGRFFDPRYGADSIPAGGRGPSTRRLVINERAVHDLGFLSPDAAVGQSIHWGSGDAFAEIIGVARDYRLIGESVRDAAPPISFMVDPGQIQRFGGQNQLHIKLDGRNLPETLDAIDGLWKSLGAPRPISRFFVDAKVQETYADIMHQAQVFGMFSIIALVVACLGLFGLSAFAAEQRTKEIGIRKAMGARTTDILRLLLWQFAKPVLWANVIAWPAGYFLMQRWLEGFAYHVDLSPWMFLGASALAVVIAISTVSSHALLVARSQPVTALRYE